MSRRWLNNFIAVCMVVLYCSVLLVIAGCSGQGVKLDVETQNDKCGTKNVKFSTDYQVEQLEIGRTIEGGGEGEGGSEGCGGGYTVTLGKGTTKDAEMGVISELLQMVRVLAGGGINPQTQAIESIVKDSAKMNTQSAAQPIDANGVYKAGVDEGRRIQTRIFNGSISSKQFKIDGAGNVWIDGKINPTLPLKQE